MNSILHRRFVCIALFTLAILSTCQLLAQNNLEAKKHYERYEYLLAQEEYDSLVHYSSQAYLSEAADAKPDTSFLAKCTESLGWLYSEFSPHHYSINFYKSAAAYHYLAGNEKKSLEVFEALKTVLSNEIASSDTSGAREQLRADGLLTDTVRVIFSIDSVLEIDENGATFFISAGMNHGVFIGSRGGVLTVYNASDEARDNLDLGAVEVLNVSPSMSLARITFNESGREHGIIAGDNAEIQVLLNSELLDHPIIDLIKLNVQLQDEYTSPHYYAAHYLNNKSRLLLQLTLTEMLANIHRTAAELLSFEEQAESWNEKIEGGRFKGLNILEAMSQATEADLRMFLEYIKSYPYKYIGIPYRLDETFATWALNDAPLPDNIFSLLDESLFSTAQDPMNPGMSSSDLSGYIDDIEQLGARWDSISTVIYNEHGLDSSLHYLATLREFAHKGKRDDLVGKLDLGKGTKLLWSEDYKASIPYFDEAIEDSIDKVNAYWYRSIAYFNLERYTEAVSDCDTVIKYADWFAAAYGNKGAALIRMGQWKRAQGSVNLSYEKQPEFFAWTVNKAHLFLLMNNKDSAEHYYKETLTKLKTRQEFASMLEGFDLFVSNGWQESDAKLFKAMMQRAWDGDYENKVTAIENFELAKTLEDAGKFSEAILHLDTALSSLALLQKPDKKSTRNYLRWKAYCNYKLKEYNFAARDYKSALDISIELNEKSFMLDDFDALGNVYSWLNDDARENYYDQLEAAVKYQVEQEIGLQDLFYMGIRSEMQGEEPFKRMGKDLELTSEVFKSALSTEFDSTTIFIPTKQSKEAFKKEMDELVSSTKINDLVIVHYAGEVFSQNDRKGIIAGKDSIYLNEVFTYVSYLPARRIILIFDAPEADLVSAYKAFRSLNPLEEAGQKDLCFIEPQIRVEHDSLKTSLLSDRISEILNTSKSGLSAHELISKLSQSYLAGKFQLGLSLYSEGRDFDLLAPIERIETSTQDTLAPELIVYNKNTRGTPMLEIAEKNVVIAGRATDAGGVAFVTINNERIVPGNSGRFKTNVTLLEGDNLITVTAVDMAGNVSKDDFNLTFTKEEASQVLSSGGHTDYALLFATDEYEEWSDLSNPIFDAATLGEILSQNYGFEVEVVKNPTREEIMSKMVEYIRKDYGPKDQLLVFFAGHGEYDPYLQGQLVCKDSKLKDDIKKTYLQYNYLIENLNNIPKCNNVMIILDVCFGGAFFDKKQAVRYQGTIDKYIDLDGFEEKKRDIKTRLFLTSGSKEYVPDGRPGAHSPFAAQLIEALNSNGSKNGYLTLADLVSYVQYLPTNPRYGPFGNNQADGDFIFRYRGREQITKSTDNLKGGL